MSWNLVEKLVLLMSTFKSTNNWVKDFQINRICGDYWVLRKYSLFSTNENKKKKFYYSYFSYFIFFHTWSIHQKLPGAHFTIDWSSFLASDILDSSSHSPSCFHPHPSFADDGGHSKIFNVIFYLEGKKMVIAIKTFRVKITVDWRVIEGWKGAGLFFFSRNLSRD